MNRLEERLEKASSLLNITPEKLIELLKKAGLPSDPIRMEAILSHADKNVLTNSLRGILETCREIVENNKDVGTELVLSSVVNILCEKEYLTTIGTGDLKNPTQMTDLELITAYGPNCSQDIYEELMRRSKGDKVIKFNSFDRFKHSIEESVKLLKKVRRGSSLSSEKNCLPVGCFEIVEAKLCPIHSYLILVDDYCHECYSNWKDIDDQTRQAIAFAIKNGMINPSETLYCIELQNHLKGNINNDKHIGEVISMLHEAKKNNEDMIEALFLYISYKNGRKFINEFSKAEASGSLPNLRVAISSGCNHDKDFGLYHRFNMIASRQP